MQLANRGTSIGITSSSPIELWCLLTTWPHVGNCFADENDSTRGHLICNVKCKFYNAIDSHNEEYRISYNLLGICYNMLQLVILFGSFSSSLLKTSDIITSDITICYN